MVFGSINRRKGPVFTDMGGKGRQPMVAFDLSGSGMGYKLLRRALGYFGFLSAMGNGKNEKDTVFGGPADRGIHPRPVIQYGKRKDEAEAPKPPTREGAAYPGYIVDKDRAFSY